ncbi:cytochrome c3 family protein [Isosphaeraceae bacterium EP7]
MSQLFHPRTNTFSRLSVFGSIFFVGGVLYLGYVLVRSPYQTEVGIVRDQPVPFMHKHHVAELGIDCRYCHTQVENASNPGMPTTETCMSCHSQVWLNSPLLEPVRASWRDNKPIQWTKLHDLPDFVYFNHGIHVQKGVRCTTCHGDVSAMAMMYKDQPMTMQWCLECHRDPLPRTGPLKDVFANGPPPGPRPVTKKADYADARLFDRYLSNSGKSAIQKAQDPHFSGMTNCSTCHR